MLRIELSDMVVHLNQRDVSVRKKHSFSRASLFEPLYSTGEAIATGYSISKSDGPLPFADIAGMTYAIYDAGRAWYDFFTN